MLAGYRNGPSDPSTWHGSVNPPDTPPSQKCGAISRSLQIGAPPVEHNAQSELMAQASTKSCTVSILILLVSIWIQLHSMRNSSSTNTLLRNPWKR